MLNQQLRDEIRNLGNPLRFDLRGSIYDNQLKLELTEVYNSFYELYDAQVLLDDSVNQRISVDELPYVIVAAAMTGRRYAFEVDNKVINLNANQTKPKKLVNLYKAFLGDVEFKNEQGSDTLVQIARIRDRVEPVLRLYERKGTTEKDGAHFNYINTTCIDLKRYQIYKRGDTESKLHCLVHAFQEAGISAGKLKAVSVALNGALQKKYLIKISQIIKSNICIHHMRGQDKERQTTYGEFKDTTHIALYEGHYFLYEEVKTITAYASKNYRKVMEYKHKPFAITSISNNKAQRKKFKPISSLRLIHNLFKQELFEFTPRLTKAQIKEQAHCFDNIDNEQKHFNPEFKPKPRVKCFYGDTETDTSGDRHKLLLAGIVDEKDDQASIFTTTEGMFDYIVSKTKPKERVNLYFHNLRYDWSIIGKDLVVVKSCERANTMYFVCVNYKGRLITLKDSYKLITAPLSKFDKMFGLNDLSKQEAINYNAYRVGMEERMEIKEYEQGLLVKDLEIFRQALENPEFESDGHTFNAIKYYKHYLNLDCLVLRAGMNAMNDAIVALTQGQITAYDINTAASLAHRYATINGAYENVYQVCGALRKYIAEAVYGGRVCANEKYKKQVIKGAIADYDGVSLYPSAMSRLAKETGIAQGRCKHFTGSIPDDADYYICTIKLLAINKTQDNPFIAVRDGDKLNYVNEIEDPKQLIIDRYTLEDYVKFHEIEYEVIEGVYWNQGFNKKIGKIINDLFQARLIYKKEKKESLQLTVKLIMNSIYGKTITSACDEEIIYKTAKQAPTFIMKNFNTINEYIRTDNWCRLRITKPDMSYNLGHVGVSILSMSKRIMNEVMDTASVNDLPIFYQDTDSMHMMRDDVPTLERLYEKEYKRELTGKNLGQFHIDFSLGKCKEIHATKSIFLGKKCYIDKLLGDGKIEGTHIRMKGVPNHSIKHKAQQLGITEFELFEELAGGKAIEFNLNYDTHHVNFEFAGGNVSTKPIGSFNRLIQF